MRPLAGGVAVSLHRDHQPAVVGHPLPVQPLLPQGDVVVHGAGVVARDALQQVAQPGVAGAGVAGQAHHRHRPQGGEGHRVLAARLVQGPGEVRDVQPDLLLGTPVPQVFLQVVRKLDRDLKSRVVESSKV